MEQDFSSAYKLDEYGLIDLDYNKAKFVHDFGQQVWDDAMAVLKAAKVDKDECR